MTLLHWSARHRNGVVRGEIEAVQIGVGRGWCLRRNRHGCAGTGVQRHRRGPAGAGTTRPGDDFGDDDRRKRYRDFGDRRADDVSRRTTYHYAAVDDNDGSPLVVPPETHRNGVA